MALSKAVKPIRKLINRALGHPDEVVVEPTNCCNLKCPACASRRDEWDGERGYMDISAFETLVEELQGKVSRLSFVGRGEPTLHPEIADMIKFAKQRGFKTLMLSNGTLLNTQRRVDGLIEAGLDRVTIGLDGLTQESYEKVRCGGDVKDIFGALAKLSGAKSQGANLALHVHMLLTKYNKEQLPEFVALRKKFAIDQLSYSHIMIPGEYENRGDGEFGRLVTEFVLPAGMRYHTFGTKSPDKCGAYKRTSIRYTGDMQLCCGDTTAHRNLGNVFKEGFFKVWRRNKETRRQVREKTFDICTYCSKSVGYHRVNKT